jgi:hypothetical protein
MRRFLCADICALCRRALNLTLAIGWQSYCVRPQCLTFIIILGAAVSLLTFGSAPADGQSYVGIDLYTLYSPSPGFDFPTSSTSIAAGGQVIGYPIGGPVAGNGSSGGAVVYLWTPPSGAVIDLTPTNLNDIDGAIAYGTDGIHQVGAGGGPSFGSHALLWSSTADSAVDLHPTNLTEFVGSVAYAVGGNEQVGIGYLSPNGTGGIHALVWQGTAPSAVDLNPAQLGFDGSRAAGTDGVHQVGSGFGSGTGGHEHAVFWSGTAASAIDLNPTNLADITDSFAYGVSGTQQVGSGVGSAASDELHALLWNSTANSAVDLHPTGFVTSTALATNGIHQVGFADRDAMLWSGTADSAIDLNPMLPFTSQVSTAYTIDAKGNVYGIANDDLGNLHAVEWSPVPEPTSIVIALMGSILTFPMRHRRKAHSENSSFPAILPHSLHSP